MPFFSVIIPLYNKENFVANTIESIFNQIFSDFEIIIVEDCSTDNSLEIVSKISSDKIKIIRHEKNKGLSASRNTGIKNATANYITFLDADDLWKNDYLEKIYSLIKKFPEAHLFATNYEELYPGNIVTLPATTLKNFDNDNILQNYFESSLGQPIYCSCSVCIEKTVFETIGYYGEKITYAEDIDFNIRANSHFKLAYSKEALVIYTIFSENQITNTNLSSKIIPDYDSYESLALKDQSLKKYLDFNRYTMAMNYKMENNFEQSKAMKNRIKKTNLNYKQRLLLALPSFIVKWVKTIKLFLVKKGIRFTTFG